MSDNEAVITESLKPEGVLSTTTVIIFIVVAGSVVCFLLLAFAYWHQIQRVQVAHDGSDEEVDAHGTYGFAWGSWSSFCDLKPA